MKLTKRQTRYLEAIRRGDWTQCHKDGTAEMRRWVRDNGLVEQCFSAGSPPRRLTDKAVALLDGKENP